MEPLYNLDEIKFAIDKATFERAVKLYEGGKVQEFELFAHEFIATVFGTTKYQVFVNRKHFDKGGCDCYLGQKDVLCKHMVAVAIYAVMKGEQLNKEEKSFISGPNSSTNLGELSKEELSLVKKDISSAIKYIKAYNGPSSKWFQYQSSLSEGCARLSKIISELPVSNQTSDMLLDLLFKLDKKLSIGGVDDSNGTVGGFIEEVVLVLVEYSKLDSSCIKSFIKLCGISTCFGWEEPLVKIYDENTI